MHTISLKDYPLSLFSFLYKNSVEISTRYNFPQRWWESDDVTAFVPSFFHQIPTLLTTIIHTILLVYLKLYINQSGWKNLMTFLFTYNFCTNVINVIYPYTRLELEFQYILGWTYFSFVDWELEKFFYLQLYLQEMNIGINKSISYAY